MYVLDPPKHWWEMVAKAIGKSPQETEDMIRAWLSEGEHPKDIELKLVAMARDNGKQLIFAKKAELN